MDKNYENVLIALKLMIENDDTEQYMDATSGEFHPDDENARWLEALQTAQQTYYEATGEVVANDMGVVLIPGKANEDNFGFVVQAT